MTCIVGLTGSIAMGKSTVAAMVRRDRVPLFDADAAVHRLLAPGGAAVAAVLTAFPDAGGAAGGVDRGRLGRQVFADKPALRRLEAILHPLVQRARARFLAAVRRQRRPLAVLDVPLLFETGGERQCAAVLVVSAPAFLQAQRALARPGMTVARFRSILLSQMPDRDKRRLTSYVIPSGIGKRPALVALRRHLRAIAGRRFGLNPRRSR